MRSRSTSLRQEPDQLQRVDTRRDPHELDGRFLLLAILFVLPLAGLLAQLWHLQVTRGEHFHQLAHNNYIRTVDLTPERGVLYDVRGRVVAENRAAWDVHMTPDVFRVRDGALTTLTEVLHLSAAEQQRIAQRLERGFRGDVLVRRDITRDQLAALEARRGDMPGVYVRVNQRRHYPFDGLGAHLVGFMNQIREDELGALREFGYQSGDFIGRTGLERAFEAILRGAPGMERQVVRVRGQVDPEEIARELLGAYRRVDPVPGRNLHLTIDMQLQEIIEEVTEHRVSGGVVVLDPRDGSILAMFSKPGFNPNAWSGRLSTLEQRESDNNPFHPMLDKSVQSWFPGSTYKIIPALAALEEGIITMDDTINCPGYLQYGDRRFRCWNRGGHGATNLRRALAQSCDVYFYQLGLQLGIDRMASYAYEFGFGERPGLGFNGDSPGVVPTREWHDANSPGGFQYGFTVNTSVGQGDTRVSPLQLALAYAALFNGGHLYYPRIVDRITNPWGTTLFEYPRRTRRTLRFTPAHRAQVIDGLRAVLHDDIGTAHAHALRYITVAGKTGTAQVRSLESVRLADGEIVFRDRDHAWFVAVAPMDQPRIVVAVFLEHGGGGSGDAAPVAMRIIDRYFREVLGWNDVIEQALASRDFRPLQALLGGGTHGPPMQGTAVRPAAPVAPADMLRPPETRTEDP
jgi:penicillin-binding protein 2